MSSPVLDGQSLNVLMLQLFTNCRLVQENGIVLVQTNSDVHRRVSVDSFRTFVGAIGGTKPNNVKDLWLISDGFKLIPRSTAVVARPS
jgi:hypothetical protein